MSQHTLTCTSTHCERSQECRSPHECSGSAKQPVPFTQYVLPNGRATEVTILVSPGFAEQASKILARGLTFECEVLTNGQVSLTITDPDEGDLDIRVVNNGPLVRDAVEDLIANFGTPA